MAHRTKKLAKWYYSNKLDHVFGKHICGFARFEDNNCFYFVYERTWSSPNYGKIFKCDLNTYDAEYYIPFETLKIYKVKSKGLERKAA